MDYLPIHEHGIIGDLHSIALVGTDGRIDWYCCPRFDSPSVFGAILDKDKGGFYRIAPVLDDWVPKQLYLPDTNVLITRFLTPAGVGEVQDFMPISQRRVRASPPPDPARARRPRRDALPRGRAAPLRLRAREARDRLPRSRRPLPLAAALARARDSRARWTSRRTGRTASSRCSPGRDGDLRARAGARDVCPAQVLGGRDAGGVRGDRPYWRRWLSQCRYQGRWREIIYRSALTLKLMTYRPTGAIVAAPTTSLPEHIGGVRNYDYRYTWIRDAAFSLYALLRLGFTEEATAFMDWLTERFREERPAGAGPLQIMYGIDGAARARGGDPRAPRGIPRLEARPDRERGRGPAPARHLRRADRLGLHLQQPREPDRAPVVDGPDPDRRLGLRELGPGR